MKTHKIRTVRDAMREKIDAEARAGIGDTLAPARPKLHPAVGELMRKGKIVYYATINGEHVEGSSEELNRLCVEAGK